MALALDSAAALARPLSRSALLLRRYALLFKAAALLSLNLLNLSALSLAALNAFSLLILNLSTLLFLAASISFADLTIEPALTPLLNFLGMKLIFHD